MSDTDQIEEQQGSRIHPLSVVRMLWKRRWLALTIWVILTTASLLVIRALPPIYKAEAVVLVDSQKIPETFVSSTVGGDVADRLALLTQSIMTSARLLEIVKAFDLYRDQRARLTQTELLDRMHRDISVNFEKDWTGDRMKAFRLGYQGHDPGIVAEVTNRLASLYVAENVRSRENQAEGTVEFLRRQLDEAKKGLDEQEEKVARFKQEHNGALPEQETSLLGTMNSLTLELQGIQTSIARAQENKLSLEAALSAAESSQAMLRQTLKREAKGLGQISADGGKVIDASPEMLSAQLRALRLRYTPDHPEVKALEKELAEAKRAQIEQDSNKPTGGIQSQTAMEERDEATSALAPELTQSKERISTLRAQIAIGQHQIESLDRERKQLAAAIADCQARINRLPLVEQEMAGLKRNYEESANNYNSLLQKKLAAGMATDMERSQKSERFTVIDPARVPERPEKPKRPLLAGIATVAGLALALLTAFVLEFRRQVFLGEWELPPGIMVLGRVPTIDKIKQLNAAEVSLLIIGCWIARSVLIGSGGLG